jgi:hypothetical protein
MHMHTELAKTKSLGKMKKKQQSIADQYGAIHCYVLSLF